MKNNIFKKTFIIIAAILLPLVFSIVAATWFMISEETIEPIYNPNSLFYKHLNDQYAFYDGEGHLPHSDLINFEKLQVTYECKNRHNGKMITTDKPTDPGQYIIKFSSPLDETEKGEIGYQTTDVVFTIFPKFETKFYSDTLITNTTQGNAQEGTFTIDPSTLTRVKSTYVSNSNPIVEYTARISFTKNTGSEYSNFNVSGVLVSFYGVADINNQYYATIDDAIKTAGSNTSSDTINIMVNSTNPKLDDSLAKTIGAISFSNNVTIASGDTLLIAYRTGFDDTNKKYTHNLPDNTYNEESKEWGANFKKDDGGRTFADCDPTTMSNFLKNVVYIKSDKSLVINSNSTLKVTGILGQAYCGTLQGYTSRDYSEIKMMSDSTINNSGEIILGGYIKEINDELEYVNTYKATVKVNSGGYIYMPYVISDNRGGPSTIGAYVCNRENSYSVTQLRGMDEVSNPNIMPMTKLDMPNIQTKIIVYYGGVIEGYCDIFTTAVSVLGINVLPAKHNCTIITLFGAEKVSSKTEPFISLKKDSEVHIECKLSLPGYTIDTVLSRKTTVSIYGNGVDFDKITLTMSVLNKNITILSSSVVFGLSDMIEYKLYEGVSTLLNDFKLYPGCTIALYNDANLRINKQLTIYTSFVDNHPTLPYTSAEQLANAGRNTYAELILNDSSSLTILASATVGGKIRTTSPNCRILIDKGATLTTSTEEGWGEWPGMTSDFKFVPNATPAQTESFELQLFDKNNRTVAQDFSSNVSAVTYHSILGENGIYGWVPEYVTISYNTFGFGTVPSEEVSLFRTNDEGIDEYVGYTINNAHFDRDIFDISSARPHFSYAWDKTERTIFNDITIDVAWTANTYTITYVHLYYSGSTLIEGKFDNVSVSNPENTYTKAEVFNLNDKIPVITTEGINYKFSGWYYDKECKIPLYNLNDYGGNLTIYGKWESSEQTKYYIYYHIKYGDTIEVRNPDFNSIEEVNDTIGRSIISTYDYNTVTINKYIVGWYTEDTFSDTSKITATDSQDELAILMGYAQTAFTNGETEYHIYIKVEDKYSITYVYPDKPNNPTKEFYPKDKEVTLKKDSNYGDTGDYFYRWVNAESTKAYIPGKSKVNSSIELTLKIFYKITITTSNASVSLKSDNSILASDSATDISSSASSTCYILNGATVKEISITFSQSSDQEKTLTKHSDGTSTTVPTKFTVDNSHYTIKASSKASTPCITSDTLITLADGSQIRVDQVQVGDNLLVLNHLTGKLESIPASFLVRHQETDIYQEVTKLLFSNGTYIKIIGDHTFYDATLCKYITINKDSIVNYIGHNFIYTDSKSLIEVELKSVESYFEYTQSWSIGSYQTVTSFANGILHCSAYMDPFLNVFDIDKDTLMYINVLEDIEKYGLYTYDDFKDYFAIEEFELLNVQYFKISVGKGYITWDELLVLIDYCRGFDDDFIRDFEVDINPKKE